MHQYKFFQKKSMIVLGNVYINCPHFCKLLIKYFHKSKALIQKSVQKLTLNVKLISSLAMQIGMLDLPFVLVVSAHETQNL